MTYIRIAFELVPSGISELIMASLINEGFEGFEEATDQLICYIGQTAYNENVIEAVAEKYDLKYTATIIPAQNWNAQWEENFQPVIIDGFCTVKAHFHTLEITTPYQILITPKMSFGTGHHATTQLMMMQMKETDFKNKSVLDFGTGTGILAILSEQLGAAATAAIDTDEWSFENAKENIIQNKCKQIIVSQRTLEDDGVQYDVILANINRHILLENMELLYKHTRINGTIIMSGLLLADQTIIVEAAISNGFVLKNKTEMGDWLSFSFNKI